MLRFDKLLIVVLLLVMVLEISVIMYSASLIGIGGKHKIVSEVKNPNIDMVSIRCLDATEDYTIVMLIVRMFNPNTFETIVYHVKVSVYVNEIYVIRSINESSFKIKPLSTFEYIKVERIRNDDLVDAIVSHLSNNEESVVKVLIDISFSIHPFEHRRFPFKIVVCFKTDILGTVTSEINKDLPEDVVIETPSHRYKLRIMDIHLSWNRISESYIEVIGFARARNIGNKSITLEEIVYEVALNNETIYCKEEEIGKTIPPNCPCLIPLRFEIPPHVIKKSWYLHVKSGEKSVLVLRTYLVFQDKRILIFEKEILVETDIFKTYYLE